MNLRKTNAFFSILVIFSILFSNLSYQGQDIAGSDDISGGSSVFVFRQSKVKPQFKSSSHNYFLRDVAGRTTSSHRQSPAKINFSVRLAKKTETKRRNPVVNKRDLSNKLTAKADILLKNKAIEKAIAKYQEALKTNPRNQNAKLGLSKAFTANGDAIFQKANPDDDKLFDEALNNYEKAIAINPNLPGLSLQIANVNYQKGDFVRAEDYLLKEEKIGGGNSETELLRGLINLKQNNNDAALAAFSRSVDFDSKNSEAYFYQAETFDRLNLKQEAAKSYRKSIEIDPEFTEAWFDLAVLNYNNGQFHEAVSLYKQVIALDKTHPDAHANLAGAFRQLEKYAEANGEYKIAAAYIKNDADLFSEWGFCLGKVAEWDKAIARLQTAKDLSPNTIDYTNLGWAYFNAAEKDSDNQNKVDAEEKLGLGKAALQKAIELDPKFDAAYLNLGITYSKLGETQNAINSLKKANDLHQNWNLGLNELGLAYRNSKKYSEAISQFQKAIGIDEKFAAAYFNLGEAQYQNGKKKEAQKTLEKLKQLNPNLAKKLEEVISSRETEGGQ